MKNTKLLAAIAYRYRLLADLPALEGQLVARLMQSGPINTRRYFAQRKRNGNGYQIVQRTDDSIFQLNLFTDNSPIQLPQPPLKLIT